MRAKRTDGQKAELDQRKKGQGTNAQVFKQLVYLFALTLLSITAPIFPIWFLRLDSETGAYLFLVGVASATCFLLIAITKSVTYMKAQLLDDSCVVRKNTERNGGVALTICVIFMLFGVAIFLVAYSDVFVSVYRSLLQ